MWSTVVLRDWATQFYEAMVTERWQDGMGNPRQRVRRTLVHTLLGGTATHSELAKTLEHDLAESPYFDEVLREIAEFRFPEGSANGFYQLKDEFYEEYEPYFFYSRRSERDKADEGYRARAVKAAAGAAARPFTPPALPAMSPSFQRLRLLFATPAMVGLIGYPLLAFLRGLQQAGNGTVAGRTMGARTVSTDSAVSLNGTVATSGAGGGSGATPFIPSQSLVSQTLLDMVLHLAMLALQDSPVYGSLPPPPSGADAAEPISTLWEQGRVAAGLPTWSSFVLLATHAPLATGVPTPSASGAPAAPPPTTTLVQVLVDLYQQRRVSWMRKRLEWILEQLYQQGDGIARALITPLRPSAVPTSMMRTASGISNSVALGISSSESIDALRRPTTPAGAAEPTGSPQPVAAAVATVASSDVLSSAGSAAEEEEEDDEVARKAAAKRRQEEIMKQFAAQQKRCVGGQ